MEMAGSSIRGIGIDPGIDNMGVAVLKFNPQTREMKTEHVFTLRPGIIARNEPDVQDFYGERAAKTYVIHKTIQSLISAWNPAFVSIEEAHFRRGKFGQGNVIAFASLTECISVVRTAVLLHESDVGFHPLPASMVKKAVGVKGNSSDKLLMTAAVERLGLNPTDKELDEHSNDAIAIAYATFNLIFPKPPTA